MFGSSLGAPLAAVLIVPARVNGAKLLRAVRAAYMGREGDCARLLGQAIGCPDDEARTLAAGMTFAVDGDLDPDAETAPGASAAPVPFTTRPGFGG